MEAVTSLAKRRGLAFQSSEIYGGLRSSWDYGPLGVELRRNVRNAWWRSMVQLRDDVVGLETAIIMSPRVWEASGHVEGFHDPLIECLSCHQRFRQDHLGEDPKCPNCGEKRFTEPRQFNLMFKTHMGPVEDESSAAYLRPETAQGMFVDFEIVQQASRKKVPFGIAQIGKSFRNEITPGNFIFRTREFEQMEMEFFVEPGTDDEWFEYWVNERMQWYLDLGIRKEKLRIRPHEPDELAHYAKAASDVEYEFPFGWQEVEGIANRTDFDLKRHELASGQELSYFDQEKDQRYAPFVVEPAAGVDRIVLTALIDAYREEEAPTAKGGTEKRAYLALHKTLAPTKVAVLPLSRNEQLTPTARQVFDLVKPEWLCDFDDAGSIGRRYRRQDEVGTPFCVTVDFETLEDRQVTVRERDSMAQERLPVENLVTYLDERLP
ncbi:MAG TPA: glycine--tRNA ligase [Actinomycetota bacterium]|nr:glycine--tRNA ligase [Actinomycetota bacterium]